jgi:hypothetical protein
MCICCCCSTASTKLEPRQTKTNKMTYKTPKGEFHGSDHSIKKIM